MFVSRQGNLIPWGVGGEMFVCDENLLILFRIDHNIHENVRRRRSCPATGQERQLEDMRNESIVVWGRYNDGQGIKSAPSQAH